MCNLFYVDVYVTQAYRSTIKMLVSIVLYCTVKLIHFDVWCQITNELNDLFRIRDGFYSRDAMLVRYLLSSCVRPSVRNKLRVLRKRLNIGSRKQCRTQSGDSSFMAQMTSTKFRCDHPQRDTIMKVGQVKLRFSTDRELFGSYALPLRTCDHPTRWSAIKTRTALVKGYAVSSTTLVVVEVC